MVSHKTVQTSKFLARSLGDTRLESGDQNVQKGHPLKNNYSKLEHYFMLLTYQAKPHHTSSKSQENSSSGP